MKCKTSKNNLNLSSEDLEIVIKMLKKHIPHTTVWAFGSRVKGNAKPFSDLDLVIVSDNPLPIHDFVELKNDFQESDLEIKVDIIEWHYTSENFRKKILECYMLIQ